MDCRLCGEEEEDAAHLWARCHAMVHEGWDITREFHTGTLKELGPENQSGIRQLVWSHTQLSRFIEIPFIASLLSLDGAE